MCAGSMSPRQPAVSVELFTAALTVPSPGLIVSFTCQLATPDAKLELWVWVEPSLKCDNQPPATSAVHAMMQITQLAELLGRNLYCLSRARQSRALQTTLTAPACLTAAIGEPCYCLARICTSSTQCRRHTVMLAPAASSSVSTGRARRLPQWVPQPVACLEDQLQVPPALCAAQLISCKRAGRPPGRVTP